MNNGYTNTISGLLRKREDMLAEQTELRERMAEVSGDIEALDRVLDAMGYEGQLEAKTPRTARVVLFYRNELRQWILNELRREGAPLSSRDIAERICKVENRDIRDKRLICDVVKRVGKALRLLAKGEAVVMEKDTAGRYVWKLAP